VLVSEHVDHLYVYLQTRKPLMLTFHYSPLQIHNGVYTMFLAVHFRATGACAQAYFRRGDAVAGTPADPAAVSRRGAHPV